MKNRLIISIVAGAMSSGLISTVAWADSNDRRQAEWNQGHERTIQQQIRQGENSGQLTRNEANRLENRLEALKNDKDRFERNGLNQSEKRNLNLRYSSLSQQAERERRDSERRYINSRANDRGRWRDNRSRNHQSLAGRNSYSSQAQLSKPPVWHASKDGGYYDSTGQITFLVDGQKLYLYGGFLGDGRPVPNTPNVPTNMLGHLLY